MWEMRKCMMKKLVDKKIDAMAAGNIKDLQVMSRFNQPDDG